jgi:hypothetical protein
MDIHGVFYLYVVAEQATKVFLSLSIEPLLICCIAHGLARTNSEVRQDIPWAAFAGRDMHFRKLELNHFLPPHHRDSE